MIITLVIDTDADLKTLRDEIWWQMAAENTNSGFFFDFKEARAEAPYEVSTPMSLHKIPTKAKIQKR